MEDCYGKQNFTLFGYYRRNQLAAYRPFRLRSRRCDIRRSNGSFFADNLYYCRSCGNMVHNDAFQPQQYVRSIKKMGLSPLVQTNAWHKTIRLRAERPAGSTKVRHRVGSARSASNLILSRKGSVTQHSSDFFKIFN